MKIITILFGKRKPIVITEMSKETKDILKIVDEYNDRQKKKKKKMSELFGS